MKRISTTTAYLFNDVSLYQWPDGSTTQREDAVCSACLEQHGTPESRAEAVEVQQWNMDDDDFMFVCVDCKRAYTIKG